MTAVHFVNEEKRIRKQLARYGSSSPKPAQEQKSEKEPEVKANGLWDFELPEDWTPEPRYLNAEDCQERRAGFCVGDWWIDSAGKKKFRQVYPRPSYADAGGKPGDLITNELTREYFHLDIQWYHTATDLETCIRYTRQKLQSQQKIDGCAWLNRSVEHWEDSDEKRWLETKWNFLLGLWTGKDMNPPSQEQLEAWARGEE